MLDHHEVRAWADHRGAYAAWAGRLAEQIRGAFEALARIQYAAPWETPDPACCAATRGPASQSGGSGESRRG